MCTHVYEEPYVQSCVLSCSACRSMSSHDPGRGKKSKWNARMTRVPCGMSTCTRTQRLYTYVCISRTKMPLLSINMELLSLGLFIAPSCTAFDARETFRLTDYQRDRPEKINTYLIVWVVTGDCLCLFLVICHLVSHTHSWSS